MSDLKTKGLQAFIWDLLGKLGTHASTIIVTIVLARLLEPADFGIIAIVMVIVSLAAIFSDVGLGGALIQRSKLHQIHYSSVFFFNILAGTCLSILTFLAAPWIAEFYNNPQLLAVVQVTSILFIISALHAVQTVILKKELKYDLLTKVNLSASIISGIVGIALALWGAGVWSLVAQLISREIFINIFIWSKTHWVPKIAFSFKALKQLWSYGFNMFLAEMLDTIFEKADYLIIGRLFPAATLGFFHQAKQLNNFVIEYTAGSLMSVLFPVLSKIQNDLVQFKNVIIKSTGVISFITFLLLGGLYLVADELIVLLLGQKWESSVFYFKIILLSGFAYPISALMVNVLSSRGKSKAFLRLEVYKKIIQSVNLYILFAFGIHAFLYSLVISSFLGTSLNIWFATREIGLDFIDIAKPLLIQMLIAVSLVFTIQFLLSDIKIHSFLQMLLEGSLFLVAFILINLIFKTQSFTTIKEQFTAVLVLLKTRKNGNAV